MIKGNKSMENTGSPDALGCTSLGLGLKFNQKNSRLSMWSEFNDSECFIKKVKAYFAILYILFTTKGSLHKGR